MIRVVLTFESEDKILWWDHSNEISPPVFQHFTKWNLEFFLLGGGGGRIFTLATSGSEKVK